MSIPDEFVVKEVDKAIAKPWILKKHYAERLPQIEFSFGLFRDGENVGICTFGRMPSTEPQRWKPYQLYELNRLVSEEDLPKNSLSYFVSQCIKKMPKPSVLISYADLDKGHHGYIYQATNWIYTGVGSKGTKTYIMKNGRERHARHKHLIDEKKVKEIRKADKGKARYLYFRGNKREKRKMRKMLEKRDTMEKKPYPKGENQSHKKDIKINKQNQLYNFGVDE